MRITMYLMREGLRASRDLLRRGERYDEVPLKAAPEPGMTWQLYTFRSQQAPVRWANDLGVIAERPDALKLTGQSSGAVLLVEIDHRLFALTFGTGFHAIDPQHYEPDFGLRVAANSIDPSKIKLAEARGLGKGSRNAVSSLPVPNRLFALRLATNEEWIRRMGGQALDTEFALSISGADSLRLSLEDVSLMDLPAVLRKVLAKFSSDAYKEHLPQLDHFRRLATSHPLIPQLDARVLEELRARQPDLGFAAPDEFHFYEVDCFVLKRRRRTCTLNDLSTAAVYDALDELDGWADPLNGVNIQAHVQEDPLGPPRPLQHVVADVGHLRDRGLRTVRTDRRRVVQCGRQLR
ncbi:MAG: TIGR04141 family sporadically distributed protein [Kineosporiaceae bacterium]|nr:TIGR04141 family sporadically distributed protein [Kineosporiaceae bacterium]